MKDSIAVIGECMLELSACESKQAEQTGRLMQLSYGGDTLNTAVYLSRLGCQVEFVTGIGDDESSDWLLQEWQSEGVGCQHVQRFENSVPGLYMIQLDEHGERAFSYWRKDSPATRIFDSESATQSLFECLSDYDWIYLSGISLAIYSEQSRARLFAQLKKFRSNGGRIAFDNNFRPVQWADSEVAAKTYHLMYEMTDLALLSIEDEKALFGESSQEDMIKRLKGAGIKEIVLKNGAGEVVVVNDSSHISVGVESEVSVVDTTAAGDSFNAAYLYCRLSDGSPFESARAGHQLASRVIQHPGAIMPIFN